MWFDARARLAEIEGRTPATLATPATKRADPAPRVAEVASVAGPPDPDLIHDLYEERAAIREFDGGQTRPEAEVAALAEVARVAGMSPEALRRLWAAHPDARAYLAHLTLHGPATVGAAGSALGWGATRAWLAEARLRAAGQIMMGPQGVAVPAKLEADP